MSYSTYNPTVTSAETEASLEMSLVDLFAGSVQRHGARTAVVCGEAHLTYAELDGWANRVTRRLSGVAVQGEFVAIYLERSIEMIAALLGVVKSGAAYLPIDAGYPAARVLDTLEDARPAVLITSSEFVRKLPADALAALTVVLVDDLLQDRSGVRAGAAAHVRGDDAAYVIYTSGSTGKPKGVMVSHRNVVRLIERTQPWFAFNEHDVWTMFHSLAFDFSVWEIWGCLATGGRLVIVPFALSRSPEDFYRMLADERVTVLNQTPSAFSLLMQAETTGPALPLALRYVIFGGEALYLKKLQPWFERHDDAQPQLVNMYGITETTVHVSYRPVSAKDAAMETDSVIGVPIPDMQIHVLDAEMRPVAIGETGEMYVGGGGVALGYLNRPELNAERFVNDPSNTSGARMYRTGDLARWRADGELVYLGRGDGQVKINGFRIELGEIEAALASYAEVEQCCVIARPGVDGSQRLAAYFVGRDGVAVAAPALSQYLATRLPAHMMPSFYMQLPRLPLTGNGKIDRASLPSPVVAEAPDRQAKGSAMEERVSRVWRMTLGAASFGLDDNFFDVGGSSMLLIAVRAELQKELGRAIPVTLMFECSTIRTLAGRLDASVQVAGTLNVERTQAQKQRDAFARIRNAMGATR